MLREKYVEIKGWIIFKEFVLRIIENSDYFKNKD